MEDGDQLRGNIVKYIANYTEEEAAAFGYVGLRELEGKPVMIAAVVDPVRAGRPGINGARSPSRTRSTTSPRSRSPRCS